MGGRGHRPVRRWETLAVDQQAALEVRVELLAASGPSLGRRAVERIQTSRHHNVKELRASEGGALRVLFAFDPRRQVILLLGGDKGGEWNAWYEWAIPMAAATPRGTRRRGHRRRG